MKVEILITIIVASLILLGATINIGGGFFYSDRTTGKAAMDVDITLTHPARVYEIRMHPNSATATTAPLTVSLDAEGTVNDAVISSTTVENLSDLHIQEAYPFYLRSDETLTIAWPNAESKTWGLEVIFEDINRLR